MDRHGRSKFYDWRKRYGKVNEHNGWIPRDWWLEDWEKQAIIDFHDQNPLEGYRRLTFMMLDRDVVAASPSSVYRVLSDAGLMDRHNTKLSLKGTGFQQPLGSHEHWHIDIAYINVLGNILLPLQLARWLQPIDRALGDPPEYGGADSKRSSSGHARAIPGSLPGSSVTTVPNSLLETSRSSFASAA